MQRSRPVIVATLTAVALCAFAAAPAARAAGGGTLRVGGAPALPAGASTLGAAPAEQQLQLYVALRPQDPGALERFATEVSTPGSPSYGRYLDVPEFAQRFGATPAEVATVRSALAARGLDVGAAGANRLSLPVSATVAEAEAAFGIAVDRVSMPSGRIAYSNDRAPAIPAAAAPFVEGVIGLDDVSLPHRHDSGATGSPLNVPRAATAGPVGRVVTGGPQPCKAALDTRNEDGGYTADQVAFSYQLNSFYGSGNFGAGQTIALLEFEPFLESDVQTYQDCYGTDVPITAVDIKGGPGPYKGEDGESAMDIEQLAGLAPGASIVVYQAPQTATEADILGKFVEADVAKVMSSSWGLCEADRGKAAVNAVNTLLQEAAAQGQSFFVAAGDEGSTDCYEEGAGSEELAVDFPGSDPFATDVGGSRIENPTAPPLEYIWNDGEKGGAGGGGVSARFAMPSYQSGAAAGLGLINAYSEGVPCGVSGYCREVPDVAANADPDTGYVLFTEEHWETAAGTSAAAPLWAALATLTNASPACAGHTIGFANPALYSIAGSAYAANFHDVTSGRPGHNQTNYMFEEGHPYPAGPGYDMVTGLGSPIAPALSASLCALANPVAGAALAPPAPPQPAPVVPAGAKLTGAKLTGIAKGRPKLRFTLTARPGTLLQRIVVTLPPGLTAAGKSPFTIRVHLRKPRDRATFKFAYPALRASAKLREHVKSGATRKLGFVVSARESGGVGSRFPTVVPVS